MVAASHCSFEIDPAPVQSTSCGRGPIGIVLAQTNHFVLQLAGKFRPRCADPIEKIADFEILYMLRRVAKTPPARRDSSR